MDNKSVVPFNTGKIKIGVFYEPHRELYGSDPYMDRLQEVLLGAQHSEPILRRLFRKLVGEALL
jgi:hypothetical protein